jgi:ABC-type dipeptide/oligopeptide/nickel transport system permease component
MEGLGLSDPLVVQYARWMKAIASGSLGKSFFRGESVGEIKRV